MPRPAVALAACLVGLGSLPAAEVVTLTPGNADAVAPVGKEADWIHGDHVLRNDRIVAVIAKPVATRHANMTVRNVGGCIIDLTSRARPNDQLSCYYPAAGLAEFRTATASADGGTPMAGDELTVSGSRVRLEAVSGAAAARPAITVAYELADGDDFLTVTTTWSNPGSTAVPVSIADRVRADRTFTSAVAAGDNVAWWDHEWFGQTYAVVPLGAGFKPGKPDAVVPFKRRDPLEFVPEAGRVTSLPPGGSLTLVRRLFPADSLLAARGIARRLAGRDGVRVNVAVRDPAAGCGSIQTHCRCDGPRSRPRGAAGGPDRAGRPDRDRGDPAPARPRRGLDYRRGGRPDPAFNFTRRDHAAMFTRDMVRFEQDVSVALDRDAHLMVATIGEGSNLGLVMGPDHAQRRPIAVTNPIFVDVDGGGFKPNGDLLGVPLHHPTEPTIHRHGHSHPHGHDHADDPDPSTPATGD